MANACLWDPGVYPTSLTEPRATTFESMARQVSCCQVVPIHNSSGGEKASVSAGTIKPLHRAIP